MSLSTTNKQFRAREEASRGPSSRSLDNKRRTNGPSVKARLIPAVLRRVHKMGLLLEPFFTVLEGEAESIEPASADKFRCAFVADTEFDALAEFEQTEDRRTLQTWFDEGKRCFAIWNGSRLAATMWCDFEEFSFTPNHRPLQNHEVYLFAAYSHPDYRGHGLAPMMRQHCYAALRQLGKTRFYSYTEYFNAAARRFKEKLGARNESLHLHIRLFNKWSRTLTIRTY